MFAQLTRGADVAAVAADDASEAAAWVERLRTRFGAGPRIVAWDAYRSPPGGEGAPRPKLILAFSNGEAATLPAFHAGARSRRMPNLPTGGPIAWIPSTGVAEQMVEAAAAIQAVWPELASIAPPSD